MIIALVATGEITVSQTNHAQTTKVQKSVKKISNQTKYGFKRDFKFPQSWRGKWFSNNNLTPSPMFIHKSAFNTPWANDYAKVVKTGFVKGTKKYPWQMPNGWKQSNKNELAKYMRVTIKKINGNKWIILSPVQEKSFKNGFAFTIKNEKLAGQKS